MKNDYLDIMARVVEVYSGKRFDDYIDNVKEHGITEHGFPRLCANIGILMAHGRKLELKYRFDEMMELCCRDIPTFYSEKGKRGNDFSVREIVSCILELEKAGLYPEETITYWKNCMRAIEPTTYYRMVAPIPVKAVDNWAAFNAASEQIRCQSGLAATQDYIENQIASQMFSFDENGMYRDPNDPMVYDIVTRNMLSACLYYGYNGSHKAKLEEHLEKSGKCTLLMQSVNGEMPYGGRSNQFLHNEAHMAVIFEYMACMSLKNGDLESAGIYKAAANLAVKQLIHWLDIAPGQHIKNYYPQDSFFGCENYAYYDKYMVTVASFLYLAYTFCDDSINPGTCPAEDSLSYTFQTSDAFRKLFCKAADYFVELETKSDHHYDAEGIGRIHRRGAPTAICLSVPAPVSPNYSIEKPNPLPLAICCGFRNDSTWKYAFDPDCTCQITEHFSNNHSASASLCYHFQGNTVLSKHVHIDNTGVEVSVKGDGEVGMLLPAFHFDGKHQTIIQQTENTLSIRYLNWVCTYRTNSAIDNLQIECANRNGIYRLYRATADKELSVHISIDAAEN